MNLKSQSFGKGMSSLLFKSIFQDDLVNNLSTKYAPPSEKFFTYPIEFFVDHNTTASITFHVNLLNILRIYWKKQQNSYQKELS